MTARLKVGGKFAKTLLDTGTVGTNLMTLNWAQSNRIEITKMDNPIEIRMSTKNSRTMANYSAKEDVDIRNGKRISYNFLLVPAGSYDVILGMPFMIKQMQPADQEKEQQPSGTVRLLSVVHLPNQFPWPPPSRSLIPLKDLFHPSHWTIMTNIMTYSLRMKN